MQNRSLESRGYCKNEIDCNKNSKEVERKKSISQNDKMDVDFFENIDIN